MPEGHRRFQPWFGVAAWLGCVLAGPVTHLAAQPLYRPGLVLLAHEEVDSFKFQLGMACTAAVRADRLAELQELYAAGGPGFEPQDEYARHMLFYAAQVGSPEMIEWLLSPTGGNLAPLKHLSLAGRTPLELAAEAGRDGRIMALLTNDAPPELLEIAADRAARKGFENVDHFGPRSLYPAAKGKQPLAERFKALGLTERERRDFVRIRLAFQPDADFAGETSEEGGLPPAERRLIAQDAVLLKVEAGRAPEGTLLERIGSGAEAPVEWDVRGARAILKATADHDGALEKLWPLAEKQGWAARLSIRNLAVLSASHRKVANLRFAIGQVDENAMFTTGDGEPSIIQVVLEQMDLECLETLRARYPQRDFLAGLSARQVFDRFFWDNVAPPPATWRPFVKMRALAGPAPLAWETDLAAASVKRVAFFSAVEKLGLNLAGYPPDDLGEVLKAVLWLQDEPLYRAMTEKATPAQLAYTDEDGWSLRHWETWCGIEGLAR